jgi:ubiquinone/menaquinone biosynthesis C-methylase UbiE
MQKRGILMNKILEELKDEYTPKYCLQLEAAYGKGMMSEGGKDGIEHMFAQIPLKHKSALDIGSGLGGMAFYLADKYDMRITGLEVNPWMVAFSEKQTPEHLKSNVSFLQSHGNSDWPIPNNSYDIIYSKGVLTHLEKKDEIFLECYRLLKKDGLFVITDWLSSEDKRWGKNIERLVELENLILFPESENGYIELLKKNGFTLLSLRDDSLVYLKYNREIIEGLQNRIDKQIFLEYFNENELKAAIVGYQSIVKALEVRELQIFRFIARKT